MSTTMDVVYQSALLADAAYVSFHVPGFTNERGNIGLSGCGVKDCAFVAITLNSRRIVIALFLSNCIKQGLKLFFVAILFFRRLCIWVKR